MDILEKIDYLVEALEDTVRAVLQDGGLDDQHFWFNNGLRVDSEETGKEVANLLNNSGKFNRPFKHIPNTDRVAY